MSDPLCVCGHHASNHATPDTSDTRCLAVDARENLLYVFETTAAASTATAPASASSTPSRPCHRRADGAQSDTH